jgi:hypothetical protein
MHGLAKTKYLPIIEETSGATVTEMTSQVESTEVKQQHGIGNVSIWMGDHLE